jgi:hypothetical protein
MVINVMNGMPRIQFRREHPPMTNAQRQAAFRKRNPGYYQRLHAQRRAVLKAMMEQRLAAERAERAAAEAMAQATPEPAILALPVPTFRLALPAPVVDPTLLALNELAEKLAARRAEQHAVLKPE